MMAYLSSHFLRVPSCYPPVRGHAKMLHAVRSGLSWRHVRKLAKKDEEEDHAEGPKVNFLSRQQKPSLPKLL